MEHSGKVFETADYDDTYECRVEEIAQKNVSRSIRNLNMFFTTNQFITEKHNQQTNIIDSQAKRTYNVPETHLEELFQALNQCRLDGRMVHYLERQESAQYQHSGIMIDFDRYQTSKEQQITEQHFVNLTRHLCKLLIDCLNYEEHSTKNDELVFHIFYIRKPSVVPELNNKSLPEGTWYKDGFHILIPELQITKGAKRFLLKEILSRNILKLSFRDIDGPFPPDKMLDNGSACNPVHFFGCSKPGKVAYGLTHVFRITFHVGETESDRSLVPLDKVPPCNMVYELSLAFYMPTFSGAATWLTKRKYNVRPQYETVIQTLSEKHEPGIFQDEELRRDDEDLSIVNINNPRARYISQLLRLLGPTFVEDYDAWFKVVCAVAHCGTTEDYKTIAREFSKRRPTAWSAAAFETVWREALNHKTGKAPVTLGSIIYWAKTSSPATFAETKKTYYGEILRKHVYANGGHLEHAPAADVCFAMCGDKYAVDVGINDMTGRSGYCWYEFVTPGQFMKKGEVYKWRKELTPDNMHLFISDHLPKVYSQVSDDIKMRKDNAKEKEEATYWNGVGKALFSSTTRLGNSGYQNGVITQSQYRFRRRGFSDELDSYEDIIGVGNGILKIGVEPQLIKGFHEYRISKYTEIDYVPFDANDPPTATLLQAFRDIFPEPDVFNFMMIHAATGLDNRESSCILTLLVGGGQNGKSFFAKMIHNALGHMYCASGKSSLITAPLERSENANSAQMQQKDKRYFYIDEFNKSELLNTGRIKMMVTPQWQSGREMYSKQGNFRNTSNPICFSNFDFVVDTTDHGTWRRIYYYKNKVKFCRDPQPDNPYEKKEDRRFIDQYANDPVYRQAMLSIMTHYYSIYQSVYHGDLSTVPVPTIAYETEEFRNRQDALNKFITQMIVKSPGAEPVSMSTLSTKYTSWYDQNIRQKSAQTVPEIQAQMENSRIAQSLERRTCTVVFLVGHRIKDRPEDPLMAGEEHLTQPPRRADNIPSWTPPSIPPKDNRPEQREDPLTFPPMHYRQPREASTEQIDLEFVDLVNNIL